MGSPTGEIYQNFGGIADMNARILTGKKAIEDTLDRIQAQVRPLADTWEGEARENYIMCQARWNEAEAGLIQILHDISRAVSTGNENMQGTERSISNSFPS